MLGSGPSPPRDRGPPSLAAGLGLLDQPVEDGVEVLRDLVGPSSGRKSQPIGPTTLTDWLTSVLPPTGSTRQVKRKRERGMTVVSRVKDRPGSELDHLHLVMLAGRRVHHAFLCRGRAARASPSSSRLGSTHPRSWCRSRSPRPCRRALTSRGTCRAQAIFHSPRGSSGAAQLLPSLERYDILEGRFRPPGNARSKLSTRRGI